MIGRPASTEAAFALQTCNTKLTLLLGPSTILTPVKPTQKLPRVAQPDPQREGE
jgi:hypothetical protein